MIRRLSGRPPYFRALSTGLSKTRYESKDATLESRPTAPSQPDPSVPQVDGSSTGSPQSGVIARLQRAVTSFMRQVPNSLTIILSEVLTRPPSSPLPQNSESDGMALPSRETTGLLVSSFNTVSIIPVPFVSFNIKLPSRTYSAILNSGGFTASGINSAELAQEFLLPSSPKKSDFIKDCTFTNQKGGPWLKRDQGGVWWMRCKWVPGKSVQVGDHAIMVGRVVSVGRYPRRNDRSCLFYLNGTYRKSSTQDRGTTDRDSSTGKREPRGRRRTLRVRRIES